MIRRTKEWWAARAKAEPDLPCTAGVPTMADELRSVADEIIGWSSSALNNGPFSNEVHLANCQIAATLTLVAGRLEARGRA